MLERLWIYQRERFPLLPLATLAFTLGLSATAFSSMLRGAGVPGPGEVFAAAASALLLWMQMRILDESKDAQDDARYRPYRAVPRGLVTLQELRRVLVVAGIGQVALALAVDARLLWLLAAVWGYLALMTVEFFAPDWLRARPGVYMATHCPIGLLTCLYLTAFDWLPAGASAHPALALIALANLFSMMLLEIGRKIRAPRDEERGVVTYSAAWGRAGAVAAWLAMWLGTTLAGGFAAAAIRFAGGFTLVMAALGVAAAACCVRYLSRPETRSARRIESLSALGTLALHAALGPLPLLLVA